MLVLCEATTYLPWFDVTTGLIEGWQAFDDPWRTDQPLMSAEQWQRALMAAGFERAVSYPEPSSPAAVLGQSLILAQVAGAYHERTLEPAPEPFVPTENEPKSPAGIPAQLALASDSERQEILLALVRQEIAAVLRVVDPETLEPRRKLIDLGLDSLMAIELRNRLTKLLGLARPLAATLIYDHPNIEAVSKYLDFEFFGKAQVRPEAIPAALPDSSGDVRNLAESEAEALLLERLKALQAST